MSDREDIQQVVHVWVQALDAEAWDELRALMSDDFSYNYRDRDHREFTWFTGRTRRSNDCRVSRPAWQPPSITWRTRS